MSKDPQPPPLEHLPAFNSWEECEVHAKATKDDFYIIAFMIEAWMGDVSCLIWEQYAGNKHGSRQLQTGVAWQSWKNIFGKARPDEWPLILRSLGRYSKCDAPESERMRQILHLLALEDLHGTPASPSKRIESEPALAASADKLLESMRYYFKRLAEWLEAITHWHVHWMAAVAPMTLQPDEEQRELVHMGIIQRQFGSLNQHGKDWWQFRHQSLAEKLQGKKDLGLIGKAQSNDKWRVHKRPQVDELTIHWWPLLKRHHWTDRDMRLLIRHVVDESDQYPLKEDKEFADYRQKILGLKKDRSKQDKSAPDGKPTGWKVALAMVNRLPV